MDATLPIGSHDISAIRTPSSTGSNADAPADIKTQEKLQDFLRRYAPKELNAKPDLLQNRYRIDLSAPLPQFDSHTTQAFAATDLVESSQMLFAKVCKPNTLQRHRLIPLLKPVVHPNLLQLVAAGAVQLSQPQEERFVLFYERPNGIKLSEMMKRHGGQINQHFLCNRIIAPIAAAINQFEQMDISHGLVNPDNIYIGDNTILGPCASEPCGYSQPFYFEPLERMQTLPSAKGEGSTAHDYYALAVMVLQLIHGPQHFADFTQESLARSIMREGVYNALTRQLDVPEVFYDFFRGILSQNSEDRWNYSYIKPWLEGKRYNVLPPPAPSEAVRPFEFEDNQANTRRELAHVVATDWEKMIEPVQSGKVTQWVTVSLRNKELAENVVRISRIAAELGRKSEMQVDEQMMRLILQLDPHGPIRLRDLAFNLDGIDAMSIDLYLSKAHQDLLLLAKFIEYNMSNYWLDLQRKSSTHEYAVPTAINNTLIKLDRLRTTIRNPGFGFGLERLLYDLNPDMPCISPILAGYHVTTLEGLLLRLDQIAPGMFKMEEPMDRHIAAFIASKLGLQHDIRIHKLAANPALAGNRTVMALNLLAMAQQKIENMQLPGLTHWIALRLLPTLDIIHSRTLRKRIKALFVEQAQSGYAQLLADIIINTDYAAADKAGFNSAWNAYQQNAARISEYRKGSHIDERSARMGFIIAKGLAYLALMLSLFNILLRH